MQGGAGGPGGPRVSGGGPGGSRAVQGGCRGFGRQKNAPELSAGLPRSNIQDFVQEVPVGQMAQGTPPRIGGHNCQGKRQCIRIPTAAYPVVA